MTDGETSAIYSVLRGLDGVDEKMLKRPEVAYLPTVLEDSELPECVLGGQPPEFAVATDRRIIHVSRARIGNKIKKHASYPYHEISRVEGAMFMRVLNIHTTNKRMPIQISAPKDRVEAFIAFVNPKIAEHRDPEIVDAPDSAHPSPAEAVTDSETSGIYSVIRGLDGIDKKTVERPEFAYLLTVLEDGELPKRVLGSQPPNFVVATDRRIVHVTKSTFTDKIKKHVSYPYGEIFHIEGSLRMRALIIRTTYNKRIQFSAPTDSVEAFISFVSPKIAEYAGQPVRHLPPDWMSRVPTGNPQIVEAPDAISPLGAVTGSRTSEIYSVLRGMGGGVDKETLKRPALAYLSSILEDGEMPEYALDSPMELVVATDRRIIRVTMIENKVEKHASYLYHEIDWVEHNSVLRARYLTIRTEGKKIVFDTHNDKIEAFSSFVNMKVAEPLYNKMKDAPPELINTAMNLHLLFLMKRNSSILREDEDSLRITSGEYDHGGTGRNKKAVVVVATDKRIVLANDTGFYKEFSYASIASISYNEGRVWADGITMYVAGKKEVFNSVPSGQAALVTEFIRNKMNEMRRKSQASGTPAPSPAPAPASVADELLKFSELLEKGIISQAEFDAQKAKLLGS